jgi:hypothetical protein
MFEITVWCTGIRASRECVAPMTGKVKATVILPCSCANTPPIHTHIVTSQNTVSLVLLFHSVRSPNPVSRQDDYTVYAVKRNWVLGIGYDLCESQRWGTDGMRHAYSTPDGTERRHACNLSWVCTSWCIGAQ